MLPVVAALSIVFVVTGVDACGEKGFGLPDRLPAWPVFVEAGEAEKARVTQRARQSKRTAGVGLGEAVGSAFETLEQSSPEVEGCRPTRWTGKQRGLNPGVPWLELPRMGPPSQSAQQEAPRQIGHAALTLLWPLCGWESQDLAPGTTQVHAVGEVGSP